MQKQFSLLDLLYSVFLTSIVSFSAGFALDNKIVIADTDDVIIIDDLQESTRSISGDEITLSGVAVKQTLDCYPQINETTLGKYGLPRKGTEFSCGKLKFSTTSFSESYADYALGGNFPATKTLSQIGCSLEDELLVCREEGPFKAKGTDLVAYREIVAKVILDAQ